MRLSSWMRGGTGRSLIRVRPLQHVVLCRATLERLHREWPHPCPHLHREWAHPRHICTVTSAPGLGSLVSHLHSHWAHPIAVAVRIRRARLGVCSARLLVAQPVVGNATCAAWHATWPFDAHAARCMQSLCKAARSCGSSPTPSQTRAPRTASGALYALAWHWPGQVRAGLHGGPSCDRRISRCRRSH
jgi:hypothetical protein